MRATLLLGLMILSSPLLTSCGNDRPAIAKPPVALLTCADEPDAPELPPVDWAMGVAADIQRVQAKRDAMTLEYLLAMRSAWGDCRAKVVAVKAWADGL